LGFVAPRSTNNMCLKKWQFTVALLLAGLVGFGVATYRNLFPGQALAGEPQVKAGKGGEPKPGGVFSPPGTFEGGTVVPLPGDAPFKGKIGRTISESTSDWPPLAVAPKGAPNVLFIVLDDVGFAALECYGSPVI